MTRFLAWFWMGLAAGVSFIATPVKFSASSLTMPVALDVGHVTLHALNRIEWFLAAVLVLSVTRGLRRREFSKNVVYCAAFVLAAVAAQSLWLLPALDVRTAAIIGGQPQPPSSLHSLFIAAETLKLIALFATGKMAFSAPE